MVAILVLVPQFPRIIYCLYPYQLDKHCVQNNVTSCVFHVCLLRRVFHVSLLQCVWGSLNTRIIYVLNDHATET